MRIIEIIRTLPWSDLANFLTALAAVIAAILSWRNSRKIKEVHDATNSMKDELVAEVRLNEFARGKKATADAKGERHALAQI